MELLVSMDETGRLVLPKSVRRTLSIAGRALIRVETVGNKIELTVVQESNHQLVRNKYGLLVVKPTGKSFDAVNAIASA